MRVFVVIACHTVCSYGQQEDIKWVAYAGISEAKAREAYAEINNRNNGRLSNIDRPYSAEIEEWVDDKEVEYNDRIIRDC